MSGLSIQNQQRPAPRHPLYVSIQNGAIQQAMSSPSGYEDEHPEDWRPATFAEREQYLAGVDNINGNPQPQPLPQFGADQAQSLATPQSLQLAPDEPAVDIVLPVAPAVAPAPLAAPAPAPVPQTFVAQPGAPMVDPAAAPLAVGAPAPAPAPAPVPVAPAPVPAPAPAPAPAPTE